MRNVVIATTTLSKKYDLRAKLAVRTAQECLDREYNLAIVDGGSDPKFLEELKTFANVTVLPQASSAMGAGRREAISEAERILLHLSPKIAGFVFWMEPEKYTIISEIEKILDAMVAQGADLGVPDRGPLDSYPLEQQLAEPLGNLAFERITGLKLDMWSGPRMMRATTAVRYFLDYEGDYGDRWDSIFIPVIRAIAEGKKVINVPIDYVHPPEQTLAEETAEMLVKRIEQLSNLVPSMLTEAIMLDLYPRAKA